MKLYEHGPNSSSAYLIVGQDVWVGRANKGTASSSRGWQIEKLENTGAKAWISKWPVDATSGKGSDAPNFIWDDAQGYSYNLLGT